MSLTPVESIIEEFAEYYSHIQDYGYSLENFKEKLRTTLTARDAQKDEEFIGNLHTVLRYTTDAETADRIIDGLNALNAHPLPESQPKL